MRGSIWPENSSSDSSTSNSLHLQPPPPRRNSPPHSIAQNPNCKHRCGNVFQLLTRREVSPQTKRSSKKFWGEKSKCCAHSYELKSQVASDPKRGLISWVEAESMRHFSAEYCPLLPPPRSTIAAAFSPDGKTLASTHGDHTVKIIDCQSGKCLKVLSGHRRTPWVVRFHPLYSEMLASGSLDHEVRLWDAKTAECIGSRDFYRPIASIAFHAQGEVLAVASGHKLYMWHYNRRGEASSPAIVLKTRRSLRAVHFHPHGAPFLLTAEVNDLDSSDSSMTLATSPANELPIMSLPFMIWPSITRGDPRMPLQQSNADMGSDSTQNRADTSASVRLLTYSTPSGQYELLLSPVEPTLSPAQEAQTSSSVRDTENASNPVVDPMETDVPAEERNNQFFPFSDPAYWDLPFLQGWLIGQSQAGQRAIHSEHSGATNIVSAYGEVEHPPAVPSIISNSNHPRSGRSGSRHRSSRSRAIPVAVSGDSAVPINIAHNETDSQAFMSRFQSEIATSLTAAAASELPCTVKLRVWPYDVKAPCVPLDAEKCRLMIPHAVLCSEMGAHFSPCGRFLAACVACILPNMEADPGFHGQFRHDAATSPTRHPIAAHRVMYELRIYSLEEATFGSVLVSRAIRAAHCLTSIQFSPTSEHLLLAYGRRHGSLLKSIVIDGDTTLPVYTILEVYRVSDMELVRVLPSAEDEVNVACFHPLVGGGLVYGTKEGKLRILQFDKSNGLDCTVSCFPDEDMLEVPTYALEG
ncbi:uncharacterized protein LOC129883209 isoform X2 [Solanum dulcamara]|uniref:uncharacterized protein LOC129883209 isoform X2 n=1 Tax=Solanum dulcamara TaxID=45834 RepID=UPI002484F330|nr:uncharacterized protein LOC129883209 isoform X2 [Solanum dulcamara]